MKVSQGSKVKSFFSLLRHPFINTLSIHYQLSIHFRGERQLDKEYHQLIVLGKILKPYFQICKYKKFVAEKSRRCIS